MSSSKPSDSKPSPVASSIPPGADLSQLRTRIDRIDSEILRLLGERAGIVSYVGEAKRQAGLPLHDPSREKALLQRLANLGAGSMPPEAVERIYREIMSACLALQEPIHVAFLGPQGTFTHVAARSLFGLAVSYLEVPTIDAVFDAVARGAATYGVVPVENSTEGTVTNSLDALLQGGLKIRQEWVLPINHALISRAKTMSAIQRVYSHPQGLAQCRQFLRTNLPKATLIQTTSTAAAVEACRGEPESAAVASELAAELSALPVLRRGVQDLAENATRFVVLAAEDAALTGDDKTTLAFTTRHEKGALKAVLEIFDSCGVNLCRIESRPSRLKPWEYVFCADVEGHREEDAVSAALAALEGHCATVQVLGSYPRFREVGA